MKNNEDTQYLYESEENEKYVGLSGYLASLFSDWKKKRNLKEQDWIKAQNAYDGEYEDGEKSRLGKNKSTYFYKITTSKVNQFKSRATELVLPNGDKNFYLYYTPNSNLPQDVLNNIIENLMADAIRQNIEVTDQDIDNVVRETSEVRADKMEKTIYDQLIDSNYKNLISDVIFSAGIFGTGVSRGPFNKKQKQNKWKKDEFGNWSIKSKNTLRPHYEFVKVWDFFPDLDAKTKEEMEGAFFYHTMTKYDLLKLAEEEDFLKDNIIEFIKCNPDGNFKYEPYEQQLIASGNENNINTKPKRYRLTEYWGKVSAKYLKEIFDDYNDKNDYKDVEVCVWMINNIVIKCVENPFESKIRPYQFFNYQTTDSQLLGTGIPKLIEQDQAALNAAARAIQNNMASSAEPIYEVNQELCLKGQNLKDIHSGMVILREGLDQTAGYPVLRTSQITSTIPEMRVLVDDILRRIDVITNLNQIMAGDMTGQATLGRTSSGINQLMGAANIVLREFARNFDVYNESIIYSTIEWNMMFNDDEEIKGDYQIIPRVSTALIEKQIQSNNLMMLNQSLTPEERSFINPERLLDAKITALNLDPDLIKYTPKEYAISQQRQQETQEQQQKLAQQQLEVENQNKNADTALKQAKAEATLNDSQNKLDKTDIDRIKTLNQVEKDRAKTELENARFGNDVLNDEANFTSEDLNRISYTLNNQNPNLNP